MREDLYSNSDPFNDADSGEMAQRRAILLRLLRGRWHWAILLAVLLGVVGGYLGYNSQPNKYEAVTHVRILGDLKSESPVNITDLSLYQEYLNYVKRETDRIRSLEVAEAAMKMDEWKQAYADRPVHLPEISASNFAQNIKVTEPGKGEDTIYVSFVDPHPETARAGLNTLREAYKIERDAIVKTDDVENVDVILFREQQHERDIEEVVKKINDELQDGETIETVLSRYNARIGERNMLEFTLKEIDLELKPFENSKDGDEPTEAERLALMEQLLIKDETMIAMLAEKKAREDNFYYLTDIKGYGPEMPIVKAAKDQIRLITRQIDDYKTQWFKNGGPGETEQPNVLADLIKRKEVLVETLAGVIAEISDLNPRVQKLTKLQTQKASLDEQLAATQATRREFNISRELKDTNENLSRVQIGPPVATPASPYNDGKRRQLAGIGAIGGFFMGFAMVMAVGLMDRRMRHVADAASDIPEANVLGILPTLPAKIKDPEDAETAAQCVHHIRTLMQIGGSNRVFAITSPAAGSGKSSLATALGMSFAASGARTLLIDCDLVGAGLTRRMGTIVHEPLEAVIRRSKLLGEADLSSALTKATAARKPLAQVLLDEQLLTEEQVDTALRLQRDTSLGLLDACGPSSLRPPVARSNDDDLFIMIDGPSDSAGTSYPVEGESSMSLIESSEHNRLKACVAETDIENLSILPVGKARPSDASRLSPAAMRELVRQAREAFDIVLIDTGPVLGSIEASITAAEADSTVMIVSRGDQKSLATRSLDQLRSVRANIAGIVFNHALDSDLAHTAYASVVSQERRIDRGTRKRQLKKANSARLGPLGSAVASFTDEQPNAASGDSLSHLNGGSNGHPGA